MPKSIFFNYADNACPYHRCLLPARFCWEYLETKGWDVVVGDGIPPGHDAYVLHGLVNRDDVLLGAQKLRRKGARFVWSMDDDWTTIPDWNPAKPNEDGLACHDILREISDFVLVSTPYLATKFPGKHVLTAPNLLDLEVFPTPPSTEVEVAGVLKKKWVFEAKYPVHVVWVGGPTHKEDVTEMTDAIDRLLGKYRDKVAVTFMGMMPPSDLLKKYLHRGLFHQPSTPFPSYQKILNSMKPDVYLAPLASIEFNKSKSNLRVIEGWAQLAAPVASDWGEYSSVRSGTDGRLVADSEGWYSALSRLVTDHDYRFGLAANGRERVESEYNWGNESCREPWYRAFDQITAGV